MAGSKKASVFPDPVAEMPIMSRPNKAMGHPWLWIGDAVEYHAVERYVNTPDEQSKIN